MLQLSTVMHRKQPGYEVKSIITFIRSGDGKKEIPEHLKAMRAKLEQTLPGVYKTKYNLSTEELILSIRVSKASEAQAILYKLEDFIKASATSLKIR